MVQKLVSDGQLPTRQQRAALSSDVLKVIKDWKKLTLKDGVLFRHRQSEDGSEKLQLLLPEAYRDLVCRMLHDDMGHLGQDRTISLCADRFFWPSYTKDIVKWIS